VVLGSFVQDGVAVAGWLQAIARGVTVFYDIDTPVTLAKLARGDHEYLSPDVIPPFDCYLSFAGGSSLTHLEGRYGAKRVRALYCAVDPEIYRPLPLSAHFDLGYLGTYSADRQRAVEQLLIEPARALPERAFVVAGPQYPADLAWPTNVAHLDHVPPDRHPEFYNRLRFTLNVTRAEMLEAGWSPSVRLFEAAACGIPIISDDWPGLGDFLVPGEEILVAHSTAEMVQHLTTVSAEERARIAAAARNRVLSTHTATCRARQFESHLAEAGVHTWRAMAVSA
jgi:spore maturation protein CgeB